ncbi:Lysine-2,3-aminomutase family [Carpediemonas membranifera]|uniref:L-lysine 2,3-aminomutase n=1 Tax=Carpediemonas membranifera TaxID=201153 RepID=A0A8J6DZ76_9EUKA|nr:Lysine-2,3-aminomutase family [Carpediemonas membranifera]|eukprot:KAG9390338.1 Lysine-2,3-aminomutase family [Carpediemonas membranifera]
MEKYYANVASKWTTTAYDAETDPSVWPNCQKFPLYTNVSQEDWEDWRWQMKHSLRTKDELEALGVNLVPEERKALDNMEGLLKMSITPYWAVRMDFNDPSDPLRIQSIPTPAELETHAENEADPLGEDHDMAVPGLVHRYPDRVLFLCSTVCSMYCRFCTRNRVVAKPAPFADENNFQQAIDYITNHTEIRDVLISGGDSLLLSDQRIDQILTAIRAIPHVEFVRIGSRVPSAMPYRVTPGLIAVFNKHSPVWLSVHFDHIREMSPQARKALTMLADAGIPLGNQTVLMRHINDNVAKMKTLTHELLKNRVRPYYIYQCDLSEGLYHFRTPVARGIEIIENLRGWTSGYAVPSFVVDAPGGGGKIVLQPQMLLDYKPGEVTLRNFEGMITKYYEPAELVTEEDELRMRTILGKHHPLDDELLTERSDGKAHSDHV